MTALTFDIVIIIISICSIIYAVYFKEQYWSQLQECTIDNSIG
jgi:hypothetical protein